MSGQLAAWKKIKPMTLGTEILTPALKDLDLVWEKFKKDPNRENIAAYSGALKNVARATTETMKKVDPKKQDKVYKWLSAEEARVLGVSHLVTGLQKEFAEFMQGTVKRRELVATALNVAAKKPEKQVVDVGAKQALDFLDWMNKHAPRITSDEMTAMFKFAVSAKELLLRMQKVLDNPSMDSKKRETEIKGIQGEMVTTAVKLKAPIKFTGMKTPGMPKFDVVAK